MDNRVIYQGGYIPDLSIDFDKNSDYYGWLLYKHQDGQWVTLVDLRGVMAEQENKRLLEVVSIAADRVFRSDFGFWRDDKPLDVSVASLAAGIKQTADELRGLGYSWIDGELKYK